MNIPGVFSLFCVVFYAALCSADVPRSQVERCLTEYGNIPNRSVAVLQISSSDGSLFCSFEPEDSIDLYKSVIYAYIKAIMSDKADCLIQEFNAHKAVLNIRKIRAIKIQTILDYTERENQLTQAIHELTEILEKIADHCQADKQMFIKIFPTPVQNITLKVHQKEYCVAQYVFEKKLLELTDITSWNPHNIDPESVDCDRIMDAERATGEKEVRDILAIIQITNKELRCVLDAYYRENVFDIQAAYVVVFNYLDLPNETKESASNNYMKDFQNFLAKSISSCHN